MTSPSDETPSEDWAEQNVSAAPTEPIPQAAAVRGGAESVEVDDADREDQRTPVYDGDEDER